VNNQWSPPATEEPIAAVELEAFTRGHLLNQGRWNREVGNQNRAEHLYTAGGHRTHGEFGMPRHTQFSYEQHVERDAEPVRDLGRNGNAASGQCQNDNVGAISVLEELACQLPPSVGAIAKAHVGPRYTIRLSGSGWRTALAASTNAVPMTRAARTESSGGLAVKHKRSSRTPPPSA